MKDLIKKILFTLLISSNCNSQTINHNKESIIIDTSKIAVLNTEKYYGFKKYKSAILDNSEVLLAEKLLDAKVKEYNEYNTLRPINFKEYNRQYVAAINQKGEKIIFINCYCEQNGLDWKVELVEVNDGGNCFFSLIINLTLQIVKEISVNGP